MKPALEFNPYPFLPIMEYVNIKLETVGDIRFVGARPVMRATWLSLLIYCCKQENSGRIVNCRQWGDGTWAQIAGLKKAEVHAPAGLWEWQGDDLIVWGYPIHNEQVCRTRRAVGRTGGIASGASRRSSKSEANASPIGSPNGEAKVEQKEKEGKEKEVQLQQQRASRSFSIPGLEEARDYAVRFSKGNTEALVIPMAVVTQWHDARETVGWEVVKSGVQVPITDWQADLRNFARAYAKNERQVQVHPRSTSAPRERVVLTTAQGWGADKKSTSPSPAS